ncbi:MAG: SUMF1/EgtB/PvdO family nonheme iron enzyme [Proteobacteria bacterium]|nr:SUMF1/EgtB/PvdO family nonheme iron enzyme [Pseudomonadota bacterium]
MNQTHKRYLGTVGLVGGTLFLWIIGTAVGAAPASQGDATPYQAECRDEDGDGFGLGCAAGRDCNDWDDAIYPGRPEVCNYRDDDCNAIVDDGEQCDAPPIDPSPVTLPAGPFWMGSIFGADDESPIHRVYISEVIIDRHEVTNKRYLDCVSDGVCEKPTLQSSHRRQNYFNNPEFQDYPVIMVSWQQADTFCKHSNGRLPTEAEWEKAARGDTGRLRTWPWGEADPTCTLANMGGAASCVGDTDRVGRRPAGQSPYGAMDMAGNVWEWVADWYDPNYYETSPARDPEGPVEGRLKVMRGGCWVSGADSLRVSCRKAELPAAWANNVGFRCAYQKGGQS